MMKRLLTIAAVAAGGAMLAKNFKQRRSGEPSAVTETIDVDAPVRTVYNQWTQFEQFPQFMSTVKEVRQLSDTKLHWRATVAGKEKEWDAEITEQIPDQRIAWRSTSGVTNEGVATFEPLGDNRTRITLEMTYQPEAFAEQAMDAFGAVKMQTRENLSRFKKLLESRGSETGAWRGTVSPHH